jgi:butyrate kinase
MAHGTYRVDEQFADLRSGVGGDPRLEFDCRAPPAAGHRGPRGRGRAPSRIITGMKAIRRRVISHALNQVATASRYAEESETFYETVNVIVAHLGGGISVGAHCGGRYIDANNALDGEGPFSPERSGGLPQGQFAELCFSGRDTHAEVKRLIKGAGGLIDLLGTSDYGSQAADRAGDADAAEVFDDGHRWPGRCALVPAFEGERLDRVILTGGMVRSKMLMKRLQRYLAGLPCGITAYPGENEMVALAKGALRVLYGREAAKTYGTAPALQGRSA